MAVAVAPTKLVQITVTKLVDAIYKYTYTTGYDFHYFSFNFQLSTSTLKSSTTLQYSISCLPVYLECSTSNGFQLTV